MLAVFRSVVLRCILIVCLTCAAARASWAGPFDRPPNTDACAHLDRGNTLYDLGKFEEAIAEFEAGALIQPAAVFDYNLGQANRQLKKYQEALWHYDRFLHSGSPTGKVRDAVIAFMAEMKANLENKAQKMPPTDHAPTDPFASPHPPETSANNRLHARGHTAGMDWLGWSLSGVGVLGLGASGYLFLRASNLNDRVALEQAEQQREDLRHDVHTYVVAGTVTVSCSAAVLIAGIVRLALHRSEPATDTAWSIVPMSNGAMVFGRF